MTVAADHGLTPLLYQRLKECDVQTLVPTDVWERLRQVYVASAVRNMSLYGTLRKVLQRLCSSGIKVVVLKGAFLAEAVYGDDALRPMVDVDLLVSRPELPTAHAILLELSGGQQQPVDIEAACRRRHHLPAVAFRDRVGIELHWNIVPPIGPVRIDAGGLWERSRPATIAGVEVRGLSPEDLLLHLCLHASYSDGFKGGLRSICDVSATIQCFSDEINWALLVERAREWRAIRYVGRTLDLAHSMLSAGVPEEILAQLAPGGTNRRILDAARESVLAQSDCIKRMSLYNRLGAESFGEKAKLSWRRVFLSRDEMAATYAVSRNSKRLWLYYAVRVKDVVGTYWSYAFKRGG